MFSGRFALRPSRLLRRLATIFRFTTPRRFSCYYLMEPAYDAVGRIVDCTVLDCNEQAASLYGKPRAEVIGSSLASHYNPYQFRTLMDVYQLAMQVGVYADEVQIPSPGAVYLEWARRCFLREGRRIRVLIDDIGAERAHAGEMTRLAYRDGVTGLPNRSWIMEELPKMLAPASAEPVQLALIDLDHFSDLNEASGIPCGDAVLRWLAERLTRTLPAGTLIARFGADEFAVLSRSGAGDGPARFSAALRTALYEKPCPVVPVLTAAIGVSSFPGDASDSAGLLAHAEQALQSAKQGGKATIVHYAPSLSSRLQLSWDLTEALQSLRPGELFLHYQPRVDAHSGEMVSMEALVRWRHPVRGLLGPAEFIRLAEERGLINQLGAQVFELACKQLATWRRQGLALVPVSVNVSPHQLYQPSLQKLIEDCMRRHGIAPALIELEITESALLGDHPVVIGQIRQLRAQGLRLAMDDFGAGYSSLSQLKNLEMDVLKIDRAFVSDLVSGARARVFFSAIVSMAHALNMRVVAEGIEDAGQLDLVRSLGCDELQGYLLSRPIAPAQIVPLLLAPRLFNQPAPGACERVGTH